MKKLVLLITSLVFLQPSNMLAQVGGEHVYEFLRLPASARASGLGGEHVAVMDEDLGMTYHNPSILNATMHQQLSLHNDFYVAGINHGFFSYAHHFDSLKTTFNVGVKYISYGSFNATDVTGTTSGTFNAGEYAFLVGAARKYKRLSYGANLKLVSSNLESYNSFGIAADAGVTYHHPDKGLTIALVAKNIGTQLSTYTGFREDIPFDLQLGVSKKLQYLPFRFAITGHHLHQWNIRYDDPANAPKSLIETDEPEDKKYIVDQLFRHLIFSGEIYLGRALRVRVGYHHQRSQELKLSNIRSLAGYSFGAGVHIKRIKIDYGKVFYNLAGSNNHISFTYHMGKKANLPILQPVTKKRPPKEKEEKDEVKKQKRSKKKKKAEE